MDDQLTVDDGIKQLTKFQRTVYDYIVERTLNDGAPPTMREISSGTGLSTTAVFHHVHKIEDVGLLKMDDNRRRYSVVGAKTRIDGNAPIYKYIRLKDPEKEKEKNDGTLVST